MKKLSLSILLVGVFFAGVLVSCVVAPLVVPPVRANTNPTMWEYHIVETSAQSTGRVNLLNQTGAEGWELVSATAEGQHRYTFKRALP